MGNVISANDLWNITQNTHLWITHASTNHSLSHEIQVTDVDRVEHNDGSARVEIEGTILEDDRAHILTLWTERPDHTSNWGDIHAETTYTPDTGLVETALKFPAPNHEQAWDEHATQLKNSTVLSKQEAATHALKTRGLTHSEAGRILGIDKKTVDKYSSRITTKIELAHNTLTMVTEEPESNTVHQSG